MQVSACRGNSSSDDLSTNIDRPLPHSLDAERVVLGSVLLKPSALDEMVSVLCSDDFFLPAHRNVFEAMVAINRRKHPIDTITLGDSRFRSRVVASTNFRWLLGIVGLV